MDRSAGGQRQPLTDLTQNGVFIDSRSRDARSNTNQLKTVTNGSSNGFNVVQWLVSNYLPIAGKSTKIVDLETAYAAVTPDKENSLAPYEIVRIARKVFPKTSISKIRFANGTRKRVLTNLSTVAGISDTTTKIQNVNLTWDDLCSYPNRFDFVRGCQAGEYVEFIKVGEDRCNGNRVVREVRIFKKEKAVTVLVGGRRAVGEFPQKVETDEDLKHLLYLASVLKLCKGFKVTSERCSKDKTGEIAGCCERWSEHEPAEQRSYEAAQILRHRSVNCHGFVSLEKRTDLCSECKLVYNNNWKYLCSDQAQEPPALPKKRKRESYMSRAELQEKLKEERRRKINAQRREKYLREKINIEMVNFCEEDHQDFGAIFNKVDKEKLSSDSLLFWEEQEKALNAKGPNGYRWHPKIIRLCLSIWNRSPEAYKELQNSGMIKLPSGRLLQYYKNSVPQQPGLNDEVLQWMQKEADRKQIRKLGRSGGIILDEMSIQEELQMKTIDGTTKLVGLVSLGQEHDEMTSLMHKGDDEDKVQLATHVLQFVFLGHTGFRFPFAHWPTKEVDPATLYLHFWKAVYWLLQGNFMVDYCCLDGGSANRSFVKLHFPGKEPREEKFKTLNPYTRQPLLFILDPYHNFKKLRNNIEKSGPGKRNLGTGNLSENIKWQYFKDAYQWDQQNSTLKIHEKLTEEHFSLGYASKMRNHLAVQVLNKHMLFLMKAYRNSLSPTDSSKLEMTVQLLEASSKIIEIFEDHKPIQSMEDERLSKLDDVSLLYRLFA